MTNPTPIVAQAIPYGLQGAPQWYPDPIVQIAQGLLELRRAGFLKALYIDRNEKERASVIRVGIGGELRRIEYHQAVRLIEYWRTRESSIAEILS